MARANGSGSPEVTTPQPLSLTTAASPTSSETIKGTAGRHGFEPGHLKTLVIGWEREEPRLAQKSPFRRSLGRPYELNALLDAKLAREAFEFGAVAVLIVAGNLEIGAFDKREGAQKPLKTFLPADAAEEQDIGARRRRVIRRGGNGFGRRLNSIPDDCTARQGQVKFAHVVRFGFGGHDKRQLLTKALS